MADMSRNTRCTHRLAVGAVALSMFAAGCSSSTSTTDATQRPATTSQPSAASTATTTPTTTAVPDTTTTAPATTTSVVEPPEVDADAAGWRPTDMIEAGQRSEGSFEVLERRDDGTLVVWMSPAITQAEFDALELPPMWIKNQSRGEGGPIDTRFFGSPSSATAEMVITEQFGHEWAHVATVLEFNSPLDDEGLLKGNVIAKEHEITFPPNVPIAVLVSPAGEMYPRVTRDLRRTTDEFELPPGWTLVERTFAAPYITRLPNPTLNIQAPNRDSFQGPVTDIDLEAD